MNKILVILVLALLTFTNAVNADEIDAAVRYIAKSGVYIDVGRSQGVEPGDSAVVIRGEQKIATLLVQFVADKSSACEVVGQTTDITVGDLVKVNVKVFVEIDITEETEENVESETVEQEVKSETELFERTRKEKINDLSGRIAMQYYAQDNIDELNYDFSQPSLLVKGNLDNILGSYHNLSVRLRGRRNIRNRDLSELSRGKWNSRIYNLSLTYDKPETPYSYSIGRMSLNGTGGLGYIDGLSFDYSYSGEINIGTFAGTEPDIETAEFKTDETKVGSYITYEKGSYKYHRVRSTFALSGIYNRGVIDREFLYNQVNYSIGRSWSFYQSGELNINRGWRKESSGKTFQVSSFQSSVRWSPTGVMSWSVGYNNRQNVRSYDNRSIADSLFDDAMRQGFRLSSSLRLPHSVRMNFTGNLRTRQSDNSSSYSGSAGLSFNESRFTNIRFNSRFGFFSTLYNDGINASTSLSRSINRDIQVRLGFGTSRYTIDQTGDRIVNSWSKIELDYQLNRQIYTSAYVELYRGDSIEANRFFFDVGLKL